MAAAAVAAAVCLTAAPAAATPAEPVPPPPRSAPPTGLRPTPATAQLGPTQCGPRAESAAEPRLEDAERMQLDQLHRVATGAGQRVAVIDTGVADVPGLAGRLLGGGDFLAGGDGLQDCDGHGTAVAGIIAARPPSDGARTGPPAMTGIAPDAEVLSIRQSSSVFLVPGDDGTEVSPGTTTTLAEAIVLAVDQGATVINLSEAACVPVAAAAAIGDLLHAALEFAARRDVVVVAAAGNVGPGACAEGTVSLPGWYDEDVLTVGATDPFDQPAGFTLRGSYVDVAAPGTGLRSLAPDGGYTVAGLDGTSFSAPWVAGLAALIREDRPDLTAREVIERIVATARPRVAGGGRDGAVGYGVVDPVAALTVPDADLGRPADVAPVVTLPGTTPLPNGLVAAPPYDVIAVLALLVMVAAAAVRLRRTG